MSVIVPPQTDAYISLPASVNIMALGYASVNINAVVSFTYPTGAQGIPVSDKTGSALAIAPNASGTIVTVTLGASGGYLLGFQASGDTDANYYISVNNIQVNQFLTNIVNPQIDYNYPGQYTLSPGDVVSVTMINNGSATANFVGTLFGGFS